MQIMSKLIKKQKKKVLFEFILSVSLLKLFLLSGEVIPSKRAKDDQRQGHGREESLSWLVDCV